MSRRARQWWWEHERFRKVYRRLRRNFKKSLEAETAAAQDAARRDLDLKLRAERDRHQRWQNEHDEQLAKLAKEISRLRLEFGPKLTGGVRFTLYVTMDEHFMFHAAELKELGPYIVEALAARVKREFAQIDFNRATVMVPKNPPRGDFVPRWAIDTD